MLSRVADSLYWMSRYFERADNCARVIDATHSLMLSRAEFGTDQRWFRALSCMGMPPDACSEDPQVTMGRLAADPANRSSIVACVAAARENASQVREEISAEMWEQLNRLFHEVGRFEIEAANDEAVMRLVAAVREGSFSFYGVTETTMSHGEGWRFVQLGKFSERACAVSMLLDAYFSRRYARRRSRLGDAARQLRRVRVVLPGVHGGLAAGSNCEVPARPPGVPVFGSIFGRADAGVARPRSSRTRLAAKRARIERIIGRLRASLAFTPVVGAVVGRSARVSQRRPRTVRARSMLAVHEAYIDYPIEVAFQN